MASEAVNEGRAVPAPYLPFKTFLSSFDPFSQGVPPKLDRGLWNQSGLMQGLIMNAYRFFKLIDASDKPTRILQQIASKKNPERKAEIADLLRLGYPAIMVQDLMTMTPKLLDEALEKHYNVGGETKKKAATFFLQAAKWAGVPLGSFLADKTRNTSGVRRRPVKRTPGLGTDARITVGTPSDSGVTAAHTRSVILSNGGTVALTVHYDPFTLGKEDREFVFGLIDDLQKYQSAHPSVDEEEAGQ